VNAQYGCHLDDIERVAEALNRRLSSGLLLSERERLEVASIVLEAFRPGQDDGRDDG